MNEMNADTWGEIIAASSLLQAFSVYGVEGTEDMIKHNYSNNSKAIEWLLSIYKRLLTDLYYRKNILDIQTQINQQRRKDE